MAHPHGLTDFVEDLSLSIGALVGSTAISVASSTTMGRGGTIVTGRLLAQISGLTTLEGSQLALGIAPDELSDAEIAEALTANPVSPSDVPATEEAARYARILEPVGAPQADQAAVAFVVDTRWVKLIMEFQEDKGAYRIFIWNWSTSTITTGAVLKVLVQLRIRWDV